MVFIDPGETPDDLVPFCLGEIEVTIAQYRTCIDAGSCAPIDPEDAEEPGLTGAMGDPELPINFITHADARNYCRFIGGRLPTEAEWVWAAGSGHGWSAPWGNETADDVTATHCGKYAELVSGAVLACRGKSHPLDRTKQGIYDMAGSLWEFVEEDERGRPGYALSTTPQGQTPRPRGTRRLSRSMHEPAVVIRWEPEDADLFERSQNRTVRCAGSPPPPA